MWCKNIGILFLSLLTVTFFVSCEDEPDFPIEPFISFNSFSETSLDARVSNTSFVVVDSVIMNINFTDGDGDIGGQNSEIVYEYTRTANGLTADASFPTALDEIPSRGSSKGIEGIISVILRNTESFQSFQCDSGRDSAEIQPTTFEVYLLDRAGNMSNVIETPPLSFKCFK